MPLPVPVNPLVREAVLAFSPEDERGAMKKKKGLFFEEEANKGDAR